jgi:epoxyqueuosine reductase
MRPRSPARAPSAHALSDPSERTRHALDAARRQGCVAAGVVPAGPAPGWERYRAWLDRGLEAEMTWLERDAGARRDPEHVMSKTRAVLCVAWPVGDRSSGNVAKYARGEDYHLVVKRVLGTVREELRPLMPPRTRFRVCVDTAPLLERELALRAGLGFIGKNGLLIVPGVGSNVVLGELLTDADLAPTPPVGGLDDAFARCSDCTRCLDACPTNAFVAPGTLDAARCVSYLTIEKRGAFDAAEERAVAATGMLFGCDVCQDVCPWNAPFFESAVRPAGDASLPIEPLLGMDHESYEARFATSAVWRATRDGLARNAATLLTRRLPHE